MKCPSESSDGKGKPICDAKGAAVKMVSYTLGELPPITEERLQEMIAFSQRPDNEIDTSDIPVITPEQAKYGVRGWENRPWRVRDRSQNST